MSGDVPTLDVSGDGQLLGSTRPVFSVLRKAWRAARTHICRGPFLSWKSIFGRFWVTFGRFRVVLKCDFTNLLRFSNFKCPSYRVL